MSDFVQRLDQALKNSGYLYYYKIDSKGSFLPDGLMNWCNDHFTLGEDFECAGIHFWFKHQKDYNWFILRWT